MGTHYEFIREWVYLGPTPYFGHSIGKGKSKKGPHGVRRKTEKCKK